MKCQKTVTAFQFCPSKKRVPPGVVEAWGYGFHLKGHDPGYTGFLRDGDWVLTDEFGGLSSCSDEDFKKLWKPVAESSQS